jgi:hypothetical protein
MDSKVLTQRQSDFINYQKLSWVDSFDPRFEFVARGSNITDTLKWINREKIKFISTNYYLQPTFAKTSIHEIIANPEYATPLFTVLNNAAKNNAGQFDQLYELDANKFEHIDCQQLPTDDFKYVKIVQPLFFKVARLFTK